MYVGFYKIKDVLILFVVFEAKFDRRCCWWGWGTSNQISDYAGRPTYFCNADKCNGPGSEAIFDDASKFLWQTSKSHI